MKLRCARCRQSWIDTAVGRCSACGLMLGDESAFMQDAQSNAESLDVEFDGDSGVYASDSGGEEQPVPTLTNVTGTSGLGFHGIPERVPTASMAGLSLTPFEGYLLSLVDGATFVDDVVAASGLALHEAAFALQNLRDKGLIRFRDNADQNAARRGADGQLKPEEHPSFTPVSTKVGRMGIKRVEMPVAPVAEENPDEQLAMAQDLFNRGDFVRAREHVRLAWMMAPDDERTNALMQLLESPSHAKTRAKQLHALGAASHKAGDFVNAVTLYRAALVEFEPSAVIHHKLAMVIVLSGMSYAEADQHLSRAVELAPTNETYRMHLAQLRSQLAGHAARPGGQPVR